jgi:hypothetical protein
MTNEQFIPVQTAAIETPKLIKNSQQGYTLIEFMAVVFLVIVVGIYAYPRIAGAYVELKVPYVADDVKTFATRLRATTEGYGVAPYDGMTQASFARAVKGTNLKVGDVSGEGATTDKVHHGLGGGEDGLVLFTEAGATYSLDFVKVSQYACPSFLSSVEQLATNITVNGTSVKKVDADANLTSAYSAAKAAAQCKDGDTNEFVLTIN